LETHLKPHKRTGFPGPEIMFIVYMY